MTFHPDHEPTPMLTCDSPECPATYTAWSTCTGRRWLRLSAAQQGWTVNALGGDRCAAHSRQ